MANYCSPRYVCSEAMLNELNKLYGTDEEVLNIIEDLGHNLCCDYSYAASLLLGHRNFVKVLQAIKQLNKKTRKDWGDKFDVEWGAIADLSDKVTEELIRKLEG